MNNCAMISMQLQITTYLLVIGLTVLYLTNGQTVSQPNIICIGNDVEVTSRIDPVSPTFAFNWVVSNGSGDIALAFLGLDNSGNVRMSQPQNVFSQLYSIRNNPSVLTPINAPFNTTLSSSNNALVGAVCAGQSNNSFELGIVSVRPPIDERTSIPCSFSCLTSTTISVVDETTSEIATTTTTTYSDRDAETNFFTSINTFISTLTPATSEVNSTNGSAAATFNVTNVPTASTTLSSSTIKSNSNVNVVLLFLIFPTFIIVVYIYFH